MENNNLNDMILKARSEMTAPKVPEAFIKWLEGQKEEERFLIDLATKSVKDKPKHFIYIRSIVLDTHFIYDYLISIILGVRLAFNNGTHLNADNITALIDHIHEKVDYAKRLSILSMVKLFRDDVIDILWKVNDLRTGFAHGKDAKDKKFLYFGKPIFEKATIELLYSHKDMISDAFGAFIKLAIKNNVTVVKKD